MEKSAEKISREKVRESMPPDMAEFLDDWREGDAEVKLTYIQTPTITAGKQGDRGLPISQMIIGPPECVKQRSTGNR